MTGEASGTGPPAEDRPPAVRRDPVSVTYNVTQAYKFALVPLPPLETVFPARPARAHALTRDAGLVLALLDDLVQANHGGSYPLRQLYRSSKAAGLTDKAWGAARDELAFTGWLRAVRDEVLCHPALLPDPETFLDDWSPDELDDLLGLS